MINLPNTIEESLKGGYRGLYGEVVTCDMYHLHQVTFQPDVIFDIGANVGVFSRFARELFPKALIVAVEPDPENAAVFRKFTHDPNLILLEVALGSGLVYRGLTAANGAGESYLSVGLGFPKAEVEQAAERRQGIEVTSVRSFSLVDLVNPYWNSKLKSLMKIDCEGAENGLWQDPASMILLRMMDYLTIEVHCYAFTGAVHAEVVEATHQALQSLRTSHRCELDGVYFWATRVV